MPGRREWLLVQVPGAREHRVELTGSPVRIGRGSQHQVVLPDRYASATHAEILPAPDGYRARDLDSTNGTELNGRPLASGPAVVLRDGDVLKIGSCSLVYQVEPEAAADGRRRGADSDPDFDSELAPEDRRPGGLGALLRVGLVIMLVLALLIGGAWLLAPPRVSLLVLGSDARPEEVQRGERGRTDTLMTLVADRPPVGAAIVSLPRDLWVPIAGYGEERINVAYSLGGPEAAKRTVGATLGVPVDRYLLVGLQGVREIVDAAGGVEIDVDEPIHDGAYPTDDYGIIVVDIPAGRQTMDGETALRYSRTRHQDSDFGRVARQQRVLLALRNRMLQPINWWRAPAVLAAVQRTTRTDLGPLDLAALGLALVASPSEPARLVVGPGLVEPFSGIDGAYLLRPTPELRTSVAVLLAPLTARVTVLNGTATSGLAQRAAETLRSRGFVMVGYGDADQAQVTSIETRPGAGRAGKQVAVSLKLAPDLVRESESLPENVDVRVVLGPQ
jgi:LCP family protein required for cell wall assembly